MTDVQGSPNVGNVRKIDWLMSTDRDLPPRAQGASFRYVLCSTPRSGSNLIGDMLRDTGMAGDPHEYLNARYISGFMRLRGEPLGRMPIGQYLAELERRRTTPNGVFGAKIHFEHIASQWPQRTGVAMKFLSRFNQFVLLSRRDKVAQAVSLYKARVTQIWSSLDYKFMAEDDPRRTMHVEYDALRIAKALTDLIEQEEAWRAAFARHDIPFIEIQYEDVVADYEGESRKLLKTLKLDPDQATITPPKLKKQGADNDPMIDRFKQMIGWREDAPSISVSPVEMA